MAGYSIQQILAPQVILETVSRFQLPGTALSQLFGWNVGAGPINGAMFAEGNVEEGGNVSPRGNFRDYEGRTGQYDYFDNTRLVSTARQPGTPQARIKPQKAGSVRFTLPRIAERMDLDDEQIHNRRPIGGPTSELDRGGRSYIEAQTRYKAQRIANAIEFQTAAMLRGKYYFNQVGDDIEQSFASSSLGDEVTVDYRIPDANKSQLAINGTDTISATWATAGTDIIGDIYAVNAAMLQATGNGLKHIVVSSVVFKHMQNNDTIKAVAGSAYRPFDSMGRDGHGEFTVVLRALPWVKIHVVDYGLEVYTPSTGLMTWTKLIPDDIAVFLPDPHESWCTYIRGGEYVTEGPNGTRDFRYGFYPYAYPVHDPSGWSLNSVHNGMPSLPVPKCIAYGTVVYT